MDNNFIMWALTLGIALALAFFIIAKLPPKKEDYYLKDYTTRDIINNRKKNRYY